MSTLFKLTRRFYILHILLGLIITCRHFFINLMGHIFALVGIKTNNYTVTYGYPEKLRLFPTRSRTRHRLMKRDDGSPRCVACMMCETVCPAYCIKIVAMEHPDPNIEKAPKSFEIDLGRCVFCGFCVEACPEDAIRMDTGIVDFSAYTRKDMIFDMNALLNPPMSKESIPKK